MNALVQQLKDADQDFEFYPTTNEIIDAMLADFAPYRDANLVLDRYGEEDFTVLDIGAGHGKVLRAFKERAGAKDLFAIEKSVPLVQALITSGVTLVGTEFHEQSLIDKHATVTFCNPPYSEFGEWMTRVIRESSSQLIYFVVPRRWTDNPSIADAVAYREATLKTVGSFDFLESEDRRARAVVDLVRVELTPGSDDAFQRFFDSQFGHLKPKPKLKETPKPDQKQEVVAGADLPARLVAAYNAEHDHIWANYRKVGELDRDLLKELGVGYSALRDGLHAKMKGLRARYWNELFDRMRSITRRLTSRRRGNLRNRLVRCDAVDFTIDNIHAVLLWVIENANDDVKAQVGEVFDSLLAKGNVRNYKSNLRPFVWDRWRYNEDKPTHVALEYRIVVDARAIRNVGYGRSASWAMSECGAHFLGDILTVACCLGFDTDPSDTRVLRYGSYSWTPGAKEEFWFSRDGKPHILLEVRAFQNGNVHLRLAQEFAEALNVEVARLRGWVSSGGEAAEEMGLDPTVAAKVFDSLHTFKPGNLLLAS